ncbi:MAG: hypothetical protein LBJ09_03925 [Clostridiales bacterium]|jgi:hypothetical protein|nr:hypothetical protein [Clostridiales bacterium]
MIFDQDYFNEHFLEICDRENHIFVFPEEADEIDEAVFHRLRLLELITFLSDLKKVKYEQDRFDDVCLAFPKEHFPDLELEISFEPLVCSGKNILEWLESSFNRESRTFLFSRQFNSDVISRLLEFLQYYEDIFIFLVLLKEVRMNRNLYKKYENLFKLFRTFNPDVVFKDNKGKPLYDIESPYDHVINDFFAHDSHSDDSEDLSNLHDDFHEDHLFSKPDDDPHFEDHLFSKPDDDPPSVLGSAEVLNTTEVRPTSSCSSELSKPPLDFDFVQPISKLPSKSPLDCNFNKIFLKINNEQRDTFLIKLVILNFYGYPFISNKERRLLKFFVKCLEDEKKNNSIRIDLELFANEILQIPRRCSSYNWLTMFHGLFIEFRYRMQKKLDSRNFVLRFFYYIYDVCCDSWRVITKKRHDSNAIFEELNIPHMDYIEELQREKIDLFDFVPHELEPFFKKCSPQELISLNSIEK